MARRKKTDLELRLEESIRLVKEGKLPKENALGERLKHADDVHLPDSLAGDEAFEVDDDEDDW